MAGNGGTQDWFYHAPARKKEGESAVEYPAPSQIPLGNIVTEDREEETGMKRGWIRDCDSKYTRLAKMGGRKDLLRFREPRTTPTEAKSYPRVEWFDHVEDDPPENTGPRQIFLPEYMVHEEHQPEINPETTEYRASSGPTRRPPFSLQDKLTAFQRDGDRVCDKTVKLPEEQPFQRKPAAGSKKKEQQLKAAAKQQTVQKRGGSSDSDKRYPTVDMNPPQDKASMSKLLSMGYQIDWYDQREKYDEENKKIQAKQPKWEVTKQSPKPSTEYRDYINKQEIPREVKVGDMMKQKPAEKRTSGERRGSDGSVKGLFKLSKFEKASAKVDTHWTDNTEQRNAVNAYAQNLDMD